VANDVSVDFAEWHEHAKWWEGEGPRVRELLDASPESLERARSMFGRIGSSTVGAALQEVLVARAEAGHALGRYCEDVAGHIRSSVTSYRAAEEHNQRALST
jgi:hypothetical protein